ncbi:helix-turn-helix domain-containing protein [Spirosoma agri]|uniref:AraC family transcriptional regulator n=1 Tax=Spirosoma agri TaxID=1987381 RepID=A0A6M0IIJ6_9BACT|nr:helix-turn-helix domain-containing protein [Spirosoma agri]NEU67181.1 AraC family transcriptional regulator [Spirosoma agri]
MSQPPGLQELYAKPTARVQAVVRHIYTVRTEDDQPVERVLLPNFQASLLFNFGQPQTIQFETDSTATFRLNRVAILGPIKQAIRFRSEAGGDILSVNFSFDGFYRFFAIPVQQINGQLLHPDELLIRKCFEILWEQLAETADPLDRIATVNAFAEPYVKTSDQALKQVVNSLAVHQSQLHLNPVKLMAMAQGISERAVQLRFQKYVGFSPKEYARFQRFQRVLNELRTPQCTQPDWYDFVERNGYYDQSHLIHDFSYFVGKSPTHLRSELTNSGLHCAPYPLA